MIISGFWDSNITGLVQCLDGRLGSKRRSRSDNHGSIFPPDFTCLRYLCNAVAISSSNLRVCRLVRYWYHSDTRNLTLILHFTYNSSAQETNPCPAHWFPTGLSITSQASEKKVQQLFEVPGWLPPCRLSSAYGTNSILVQKELVVTNRDGCYQLWVGIAQVVLDYW